MGRTEVTAPESKVSLGGKDNVCSLTAEKVKNSLNKNDLTPDHDFRSVNVEMWMQTCLLTKLLNGV